MKLTLTTLAAAGLAIAQDGYGDDPTTLVRSEALQADITIDNLLASAEHLQGIADANSGTRVFGSPGSNATINWLFDELNKLGTYDVYLQPFVELFSGGNASLSVDGTDYEADLLTYTPSGSPSADLVAVDNIGCDAADFPDAVADAIALISRGECTFAQKVQNAFDAGAVGAVIYNNVPGSLAGTLGGPADNYVPVVGVTQEIGDALLAAVEAGNAMADLEVNALSENRTTYNVIAETKGGDQENVLMLGGHTDSVEAGPGINDDGSGIIGCLEVAKALSKYEVNNAVRFGFWSAEEFGLLGSYAYLESINSSAAEVEKLRAYLNFDMIASPNYIYGIYDGDGSAFNLSGPPGSAEIEATFQYFYTTNNEEYVSTEFDGRSDYAAFLENGIPSGGLFTGAEEIKTEEEAEMFGGEAGVAYDENYHEAGDTIDNLNEEAFLLNTKAIADSVAKYALSFETLPVMSSMLRRDVAARHRLNKRFKTHSHAGKHSAPCGGAKATS